METGASAISSQFHSRIEDALKLGGASAEKGGGESSNPVRNAAASFAETLRTGETTSVDGMLGRADPQSVVTALASAEIAVQSAVTIRDKVVESYQEILRMPV